MDPGPHTGRGRSVPPARSAMPTVDCGLKKSVRVLGESLKKANQLRTLYSLSIHTRLLQVRKNCLLQCLELDPL